MDDLPDTILMVVVAGVILFGGIAAMSIVVADVDATNGVQTATTLGSEWNSIDNSYGTNPTVYDSRGYAISLDGSDNSYFQSEVESNVANQANFTVSVWATLGNDTDMTLYTVSKNLVVGYNATRGNWTAWYYEESDRDSYQVEVAKQGPDENFENVVVTRNESTLTIYANNTQGETATLSQENITPSPDTQNWNGSVEELRLINETWTQSEIATHINNPIDPLPENAVGRVMFDEPYRDSQRFFYADGDIVTSNADFVQGFAGSTLDRDSMFSSGDYEWRDNGPQLKAVDGGELENAPVAYVDYQQNTMVGQLITQWSNAVKLMGVLFIVAVVSIIVSTVAGVRPRG